MENLIKKHFSSLSKFLDYVDTEISPWTIMLKSREKGDSDWRGTASWEETMKLARYGWPEGRKNLVKTMNAFLEREEYATNPQYSYDVGGLFPNVPKYVAGDPLHMIDNHRENKNPVKIINLVVYVTSSVSVSGQSKINWGAALVSIIDNLESLEYSVSITWISASGPSDSYGGPDVILSYDLKSAGEHLDLDKLAFWLINPSTLRRIEFSFIERLDIQRWYSGGYGTPKEASSLRKFFDENYIILDGSRGAGSVQSGYEMIKSDIKNHFDNQGLPNPTEQLN
jgi:hypothetical protein